MRHDEMIVRIGRWRRYNASARRAAQLAMGTYILADGLTEEDLQALIWVYPAFGVGVAYKVGDLVRHEEHLYEVIQAHTSQADWLPPDAPSLFVRKTPSGVIAAWVQPAGAHDAYQTGDMVTHNDQVWVSLIDANVWEPGVHGWEIVGA